MSSEAFSKLVLEALQLSAPRFDPAPVDPQKSRNTAARLTQLLCNRLSLTGESPQVRERTTYAWKGGLLNIRNAAHPHYWTNVRLEFAKAFHKRGQGRSALYLFMWWKPHQETIHVWAIPEQLVLDALPRLPGEKQADKRLLVVKPERNVFERCDGSPDLSPFHAVLHLSESERKALDGAFEADTLLRQQSRSHPADDGNQEAEEPESTATVRSLKAEKDLPATPPGTVWIEMTRIANKQGGTGWGLGECLWSPSRYDDGREGYKYMEEVRAGDLILHCCDSILEGFSFAKSQCREMIDEPPQAGEWTNRSPYHHVELERYTPIEPPLQFKEFLKEHEKEIRDEITKGAPKYYPFVEQSGHLMNRQGAYLSRCTPTLYQLLSSSVKNSPTSHTGTGFPHSGSSLELKPSRNRFWAIGVGEGGRLWNEFQEKGIVAIGWDELGDLKAYADREAITQALVAKRGPQAPNPSNDSLCCFQFATSMKPGDFVVAKIGRSKLLGVGIVQSNYRYEHSRKEYRHIREVRWLKAANVEAPPSAWVPTKTLTDVTDIKPFVAFVSENYFDTGQAANIEAKPVFSLDDAMAGLFMPQDHFEIILTSLRRKKNVVLQGPPGVGKTFVAKQIAYALMGFKDPGRIEMVQFHQSYSYEDFIQGWRPQAGGGFQLRTGVFYDFCNRARMEHNKPFVFIIDEINRGNLSKIFGELLMLIEADKRGPDFAIPLTYSDTAGEVNGVERFSVPENVYLLGLMNTADRSLAMVDYALRRRFVFIDLEPQFRSATFRKHLQSHGAPTDIIDRIVERMTEINQRICGDTKNLGPGFAIGHSFFCPDGAQQVLLDNSWYRLIVQTEIAPLLREYWFEAPQKAQTLINRLLE